MTEKQYNELCNKLNYYSNKYYNESVSEISDAEYDTLFNSLIKYENENPHIDNSNSPTQRIGSNPIDEFEICKHYKKMMSIEKAYTDIELNRFLKNTNNKDGYIVETKVDGLSISLIYKKDKLIKAVTRGNGKEGENVYENVKVIQDVPLVIPGIGNIEVRGEIFMSFKTFDELNKIKKENNEPLLANPRNAASGAIKRKDSKISKQSRLSMVAYDIVYKNIENDFETQNDILTKLNEIGFKTPIYKFCENENSVKDYIDYINNLKENNKLLYPIDGAVIKVNNLKHRATFKDTSSHPKWLIAYKYQEEIDETTLNDIELHVGKTGTITPVAILQPIELCGTIVKRASLHNFDYIKEKDIRIYDKVAVKKAGEIIPKVLYPILDSRNAFVIEYEEPTNCPVCDTKISIEFNTKKDKRTFLCPNDNCKSRLVNKCIYWASKEVMNIDGMGNSIVEKIFNSNLIKNNFLDIYRLSVNDIQTLDGMAKKSATNLFNNIQKSLKNPFENVLCGLQIPGSGKTVSKLLVDRFKSIDKLSIATKEELTSIEGIGEILSDSIYNWFRDDNNIKLIQELKHLGFQLDTVIDITENKEALYSKSNVLGGKSFCVTGRLFKPRHEIHSIIIKNGGKIDTSVKKSTDVLIVGEDCGSKLEKAISYGIEIITENDFLEQLQEKET